MKRPGDVASLRIRPMMETDADAVAQLATELGYPSAPEQIRARMREINGSSLLLVAVPATDKPIGFIQANQVCVIEAGNWVEIVGLVVSSTARRSGIGRKLIAEIEQWAKSIGAERVVVRSNIKRTESHSFYPALGYQLIKTQAAYEKYI